MVDKNLYANIVNGIDQTTGHVMSTGEIFNQITSNNWKAGYDPRQALQLLEQIQPLLQNTQTDIARLIPELGGAVPNDAALAIRDLTYIALYALSMISSLGASPSSFVGAASVAEKSGIPYDYTKAADSALQSTLGPNYAQYVGKDLPSVAEQVAANNQVANAAGVANVVKAAQNLANGTN